MNRAPSPLRLLVMLTVCLAVVAGLRRTAETSRVEFTVEAEGQPAPFARVTVGGRPFSSGEWLWPGWRSVEVTGDKLEPLQERRWVRPGRNDWGALAMRYQRGQVTVTVIPTPSRLRLGEGAEVAEVLRLSTLTAHPIVGPHVVEAFFPTFTNRSVVTVAAGQTLTLTTRVELGWVWPTAEPAGARVELRQGTRVMLTGNSGDVLGPVPVGEYQVVFQRGLERVPTPVSVTTLGTNAVTYRFRVGRVAFVSEPPGATIWLDGREAGTTPVTAEELAPGSHRARFLHPDRAPAEREFSVTADREERIAVRLYRNVAVLAWEAAQRSAKAGDLASALNEVAEALRLEPDWAEVSLKRQEWALAHALERTKSALESGKLDAAADALAEATKLDPDNATAKRLQQDLEATKTRRSLAQRDESFTQRLDRARRELTAGHLTEALAAIDEALSFRPDEATARRLKDSIVKAQADAEAARQEQSVRQRFASLKNSMQDGYLFAEAEWRVSGPPDRVWAAVMRVLSQPLNQWEPVGDAETSEGVTHLQLRGRGIVKSIRAGLVAVVPAADGGVVVLGSFLEYFVTNGFKRVPIHPSVWHEEDPRLAGESRRELVARFGQALKQELSRSPQ